MPASPSSFSACSSALPVLASSARWCSQHAHERDDGAGGGGGGGVGVGSGTVEEQLQQRIRQLEAQLRLRDSMIRELICVSATGGGGAAGTDADALAVGANGVAGLHNPHCGRWVVSDGDALAEAVLAGATHILLDSSRSEKAAAAAGGGDHLPRRRDPPTFHLPCTVTVTGDHMLLIEPYETSAFAVKGGARRDGAFPPAGDAAASSKSPCSGVMAFERPPVRIVGHWVLENNARISTHDIEFAGVAPRDSLFALSSGASLMLHDCVLRDAREAVYLSSTTQAVLTECRIVNNVRGVFESYRSTLRLVACEFVDNIFHAVLLSGLAAAAAAQKAGAAQQQQQPESAHPELVRLEALSALGNCFLHRRDGDRCRADVCFRYNPMLDRYEEVYRKGVKTLLRDADLTTGLVDESFGDY